MTAEQQERSQPSIRIVVADDHDLVRAGLVAILGVEADMEVVAEASDGAQAAIAAGEQRADVVLMDMSMPGTDGLEGLTRIRADHPHCVVIMLTTFNMVESIEQALRAGAAGYLLKTASPEEMLRAIRAAHRGERVFSRAVQDRLVESFLGQTRPLPEPPAELRLLTERELDVFIELARGRSNSEIAGVLFLSEATVKTYVTRLLAKLGLRDRVQAVIFALQHGLVPEEDAG
ncbi:DNA-binding NarL/FixJ family response regulator [Microbacterium sp. W4I4]|uniref:response regulator n=1 Tax=Microbacterium sp. W4I4 TaxID=3042295 RepID=UPI00277EF574|nr:response regulator transcription factor [Microbacterium sp. W4I4]MDQ0613687.1 DNA-binding NarL/FixJ family response regulator [Microbacterium sp. W4I4]